MKPNPSERLPTVSTCPTCGQKLDAATSATGEEGITPSPGDHSVCGYCGELLTFGEDLSMTLLGDDLIAADPEEMKILLDAQRVIQVRAAMKKAMKKGLSFVVIDMGRGKGT